MSIALVAALGASAAGCYKANFHLSPGASVRSTSVDDATHFSVINIIEVSSPVDLRAACGGAAPVRASERVGPVGALVNLVLAWAFPIFAVMNPSVDCPVGAAPPPDPGPGPGPVEPPPGPLPPPR